MIYERVSQCRVCDSSRMGTIVNLGEQAYTGLFPKAGTIDVPKGPLELAFCGECGLAQLNHNFNPSVMYGADYGYRSGLNSSMVRHLQNKVRFLEQYAHLQKGDRVLDIGSNDGTTLGCYAVPGIQRIGIDPTAAKFRRYYKPGIEVVEDFFSADAYFSHSSQPAKLITSLAMFYDLQDPVGFVKEIVKVLAGDGVWHFEQSYLPAMLHTNSFDTICHEHVSYYSFFSIEQILGRGNMRVIDISFNDVNGGSFAVTAVPEHSRRQPNSAVIEWVREMEKRLEMHTTAPLHEFSGRIELHVGILVDLLERLAAAAKQVIGYGASTKGNVLLQYAGIDCRLLHSISEINPDKFGCVTPGTHIPIIDEKEARAMSPDYFLVLPWHFRADILPRETDYLRDGGHFIFPLPEPEIV